MPDYTIIGEKKIVDGRTLYSKGYYSDGLSFGQIFKDEKAFREDRDAVCYIPEYGFDSEAKPIIIDGVEYYDEDDVSGYTRTDLEELLTDENDNPAYEDEDGGKLDIESFFQTLKWAFPETYLYEYD